MPPKLKISREMILETAYALAEQRGLDAVTARAVAAELGCSIAPVFTQFETMEELRRGTFDFACQRLMAEILAFRDAPDFLSRCSLWVVELARRRPRLFELLYLSGSYENKDLAEFMLGYESNQVMLSALEKTYGLNSESSKEVMVNGFLLLLGAAAMICANHMEFSNEEIAVMMKNAAADMAKGAAERQKEAKQ